MNVLIFDDQADTDLALMSSAVSELGHQVESTAHPGRFLDVSRTQQPDLQIVDYKAEGIEEQVGMRDGMELVAVSAAESRHIPTVFLTNWKGDCVKRLAEFDPRLVATMAEKPMDDSLPAWRTRIDEAISNLAAEPSFDNPEPLGIPTKDLDSGFFQLPPRELHDLGDETRDELEIEASEELHQYLNSAWSACQDDWLMVSRVDDAILVVDRGNDAELPTVESVRDIEVDRESGVLTIGRPTFLEESAAIASDSCTPKEPRNWRRYPHVRLIVGREERDFHLDTGSADSYISRELLLESSQTPLRNPKPSRIWNLGKSETRLQQPVDLDLYVVGPGGNISLSLMVQAVKNWRKFDMLNPPCPGQRCPDSSERQCGRRHGLIGRNLLYRVPKGVWQFDPATGQFYAIEA